MAETSAHGAIRCKQSGDLRDRTERGPPPPPPPSSPRDLISALPDAVIHHIFSFLHLPYVVRTSVLSKRWRSTWTSMTNFHFADVTYEDQPCTTWDFPSVIDSVLLQRTSPAVKWFRVFGFECDEANSHKLDSWLRFAEARRVERLNLWLLTKSPFVYTLPLFLYGLSWLVRLDVSSCCFSLGRTIWWPCLKFLSIERSKLSDDILEGILRGSPVLESLLLRHCWGMQNIIIDSTSVKELVFIGHELSNVEKILAPHLLSLRLVGYHPLFRLDNVSSLVEAKIEYSSRSVGYISWGICRIFLKELLEKLRGVPTINIGGWYLQNLSLLEMEGVSLLEMEGVPSTLSKCLNLTLSAAVGQWDLPGIAYMLRSSQCLEKLVIHLAGPWLAEFGLDDRSKERFNFDEEDFLCSKKGNFECLAKHLKRVEIIGYEANSFGSKHLLALIKFLLGDALVLEKLILNFWWSRDLGQDRFKAAVLSKLLGVSNNVLSCPRASENAEVIFNWCPHNSI